MRTFTWGFPCAGLFVLALGQRQSLALVFVGMFLLKSFHEFPVKMRANLLVGAESIL